jgi:hypothetical protein
MTEIPLKEHVLPISKAASPSSPVCGSALFVHPVSEITKFGALLPALDLV